MAGECIGKYTYLKISKTLRLDKIIWRDSMGSKGKQIKLMTELRHPRSEVQWKKSLNIDSLYF